MLLGWGKEAAAGSAEQEVGLHSETWDLAKLAELGNSPEICTDEKSLTSKTFCQFEKLLLPASSFVKRPYRVQMPGLSPKLDFVFTFVPVSYLYLCLYLHIKNSPTETRASCQQASWRTCLTCPRLLNARNLSLGKVAILATGSTGSTVSTVNGFFTPGNNTDNQWQH